MMVLILANSSAKRLPLEHIFRDDRHNVSKQRKDSEKPHTRMENIPQATIIWTYKNTVGNHYMDLNDGL